MQKPECNEVTTPCLAFLNLRVYGVNMTNDVNSVNTESESSYHHGDLRATVLNLCLEKLQDQEMPDLGIRALAREIGVSPTALYRHFPSKDDLLDELATVGMDRLRRQQENCSMQAGGGREGFRESGMAYIQWAIANPALFKITFSRLGKIRNSDLALKAEQGLNQLRRSIMEAKLSGPKGEFPDVMTIKAWSLVHGLAHLKLDGALDMSEEFLREVLASAFQSGPKQDPQLT